MVSTYPLRLSLLRPPLSSTFATRPVKLTEANVVDDAYRAANGGIQGDGLLGNQSTGIWPAATNLNDNGNATTNLTGVTDHSSTTTRATTGVVKFGTTAFNVVSGNAAANEGPSQPINGGLGSTQYTVSAWVWLISGAATVRATLSDTVAGKQGGTAVVLTATPQKVTVTATTGIAGITEASYIETTVQQAGTWCIGGWQVETGTVATPYIATDGGDATRAVSRVQAAYDAGIATGVQGWCAQLLRMGWGNASAVPWVSPTAVYLSTSASERIIAMAGVGTIETRRYTAGAFGTAAVSNVNWAVGDALLHISAWTATQVKDAVNGGTFATAANTNFPVFNRAIDIGNNTDATTRPIGADAGWVAFGTGILTDANSAQIMASFGSFSKPKPTIRTMPGHATLLWDGRTGIAQRRVGA